MHARRSTFPLVLAAAIACGGTGPSRGADTDATLVPGGGAAPDLVIGKTTLADVRARVGDTEDVPSTTGPLTQWDLGAFRMQFVAPEGSGSPVLESITALQRNNPRWPNWKGRTDRGIGLLATAEAVREAYGAPDAEWQAMSGRVLYYEAGLVVRVEDASGISAFEGPTPAPGAMFVSGLTVSAPYHVSGTSFGPPRTTLHDVALAY